MSDSANKSNVHMVDSLSVLSRVMDFQSAMETFAEAWVAANVTQVNIQNSAQFLWVVVKSKPSSVKNAIGQQAVQGH